MVFLPEATLIMEETTLHDEDAPTEENAVATMRDVDVYDSDPENTDPFIDASDPFYAFEAAEPYPISRSSPVSEVVSSGAVPTPRTARVR